MNENKTPVGSSGAADDARRSIDLAAAEWMIRRDRGFTPAEQDEFFSWLAADPRHGEWFAQHQATWQDLNLLAQWRPEHASEPNPDLLARPRRSRRPDPWVRPVVVFPVLLAVAAAVALVVFLPSRPGSDAAPTSNPLLVATVGEQRVLEDGSIVDLARGAAIEVRYTAAERGVWLVRGAAHFAVAKNRARPFIVNAAGVDVRAVGTAFDVRLDPQSVEVHVTEGRVLVAPPPNVGPALAAGLNSTGGNRPGRGPTLLSAGERTVVPLPPPSVASPVPDAMVSAPPSPVPAPLLQFNATPLSEVVAEFNRNNRVHIQIAEAELADVPIIASFRADNVEGFVRLLEATAGVSSERTGNTVVLRKAP
jgi:transmembrane sensor